MPTRGGSARRGSGRRVSRNLARARFPPPRPPPSHTAACAAARPAGRRWQPRQRAGWPPALGGPQGGPRRARASPAAPARFPFPIPPPSPPSSSTTTPPGVPLPPRAHPRAPPASLAGTEPSTRKLRTDTDNPKKVRRPRRPPHPPRSTMSAHSLLLVRPMRAAMASRRPARPPRKICAPFASASKLDGPRIGLPIQRARLRLRAEIQQCSSPTSTCVSPPSCRPSAS